MFRLSVKESTQIQIYNYVQKHFGMPQFALLCAAFYGCAEMRARVAQTRAGSQLIVFAHLRVARCDFAID